jgi:hypothetical protein
MYKHYQLIPLNRYNLIFDLYEVDGKNVTKCLRIQKSNLKPLLNSVEQTMLDNGKLGFTRLQEIFLKQKADFLY